MQFKIWFDAETQPPDDTWAWAQTQSEAEALLGLNWNREDTEILLSVGANGLELLRQLEVYARFGAITKPFEIEQHIVNEEMDAKSREIEEHWNV